MARPRGGGRVQGSGFRTESKTEGFGFQDGIDRKKAQD